jgi:hypothetical protein
VPALPPFFLRIHSVDEDFSLTPVSASPRGPDFAGYIREESRTQRDKYQFNCRTRHTGTRYMVQYHGI